MDVVVADSAYGTYVDLVLVQAEERRCRMSANITPVTVIFAPCKKLGIGDHIVSWQRPRQCPQSMHPTDFEALPEMIQVRARSSVDSTTRISS